MKPHSRHNKLQHAWLDGETIQKQADSNEDIWYEIDANHSWQECSQYRIKPAEPEKIYPVTSMSNEELKAAFLRDGTSIIDDRRWLANAAIRRAIDDGQVFLPFDPSSWLDIEGIGTVYGDVNTLSAFAARLKNDQGRDMAIAKATRLAYFYAGNLTDKELEKIIAGVK